MVVYPSCSCAVSTAASAAASRASAPCSAAIEAVTCSPAAPACRRAASAWAAATAYAASAASSCWADTTLVAASRRARSTSDCAFRTDASAESTVAWAPAAFARLAESCACICPARRLVPAIERAIARSAWACSSRARASRASIMTSVSPSCTRWFSSTSTRRTKPPTLGATGVMWPSTWALSVLTWLRP